jgi:NitT/TauT family transport system permease protein
LVFTLIYRTLAAKSQRAGDALILLLDILQSVPILGSLLYCRLLPDVFSHRVLGADLASVFAKFTSQALRIVPEETGHFIDAAVFDNCLCRAQW